MSQRSRPDADGIDERTTRVPRRRFLALGAGVGVSLLAGCTGNDGPTAGTGEFRLLVSDQPADIGDFDSLAVTFDSARVFRAEGADTTGTPTPTADDGTTTQESEGTTTDDGTTEEDGDDDDEGDRDFTVLDLDDPTVDLTQVLGEDAMGVFEGELETGSYSKVELTVSDVEGVVDGEAVAVKVPSEKLQITQPFEISTDEPVEFVFDINVVKRGPTNGYNLTPVISESGVAGRDVEYEEVPRTDTTATTTTTE